MKNQEETTLLTPYQVAQVVNQMLTDRGLKVIPPQMVYNYVRKGYITTEVPNRVTVEEAERWGTEYVTKKMNKVTTTK